MTQTNASTQWEEQVSLDEPARHELFAEQLGRIQASGNRKFGLGRALHRKQVVAAKGVLTVLAGLPEYAAQGLFAEAGEFEVVARLSNGSPKVQRDVVPDIRGFAFSVRGVSGESALGATTDRQDFLLINRPAFGLRSSEEFAEVVLGATKGPLGIAKALNARYGPTRGPVELAKLLAESARPFSGFATTTFHSAAPIQMGPYAGHVRMVPRGNRLSLSAQLGFGNEMIQRLRDSAVGFDVYVDFFVDEELTPIEDGSKEWPVEDIPSVMVATLVLGTQDVESAEGQQFSELVAADKFDPWSALADHRPLGEIMRARKVAYFKSQQARGA
ncbi:MAG: catalase [Candidatus Nanopelagicales bacterium]